ncbi:tetraacyldisaccharide 4'-kinase [Carboxylicivirga caseinilyticus]|uniref:tetraacyldisaccharide 4'-kinase n=1 Tax=Carboxylicivirga caseinilyticus TaxID=3417572 RepID=UPI003D34607F|nr:tetraacyldisaccharide 4'-kinase [Marinilabiliaceae bacterium A049]
MQIRKVLYPFSLLYGAVTTVRNKLFDWNILPSKGYNLPIISVGNITVGGTGKTPFTEYLIRLLKNDYKLALLSRGYKRKTQGPFLSDDQSTASDIGDEPFQIKKKFAGIEVVVAEKRVEGMQIIRTKTSADVVLMDDAFQHRYVTPGFSILVIDYSRPLWNDLPFPAGDLRETRAGQKRADIILVNKCPLSMSEEEKSYWLNKLKPCSKQKVFFSAITYGQMVGYSGQVVNVIDRQIIALAGIARPELFFSYLKSKVKIEKELIYPDHHSFNEKDLQEIKEEISKMGNDWLIISTEKDFTRLYGLDEEIDKRLVYVPIELKILFEEEKLLELIIRNYVRDYQKDS